MPVESTDSPKPGGIPRASLESTVTKRRRITVSTAYAGPLKDGDGSPFDERRFGLLIHQIGLDRSISRAKPAFRFELMTTRGQVRLEWVLETKAYGGEEPANAAGWIREPESA